MNSLAASHAAGEMKASEMMRAPMMDTDKGGLMSHAEFADVWRAMHGGQ